MGSTRRVCESPACSSPPQQQFLGRPSIHGDLGRTNPFRSLAPVIGPSIESAACRTAAGQGGVIAPRGEAADKGIRSCWRIRGRAPPIQHRRLHTGSIHNVLGHSTWAVAMAAMDERTTTRTLQPGQGREGAEKLLREAVERPKLAVRTAVPPRSQRTEVSQAAIPFVSRALTASNLECAAPSTHPVCHRSRADCSMKTGMSGGSASSGCSPSTQRHGSALKRDERVHACGALMWPSQGSTHLLSVRRALR